MPSHGFVDKVRKIEKNCSLLNDVDAVYETSDLVAPVCVKTTRIPKESNLQREHVN